MADLRRPWRLTREAQKPAAIPIDRHTTILGSCQERLLIESPTPFGTARGRFATGDQLVRISLGDRVGSLREDPPVMRTCCDVRPSSGVPCALGLVAGCGSNDKSSSFGLLGHLVYPLFIRRQRGHQGKGGRALFRRPAEFPQPTEASTGALTKS